MPDSSNKLSQFWQELKRRKVARVITVYAAAAFVILELTDIVAPSLGLPDWTLNLIIILLCVGFIITVIVSWIYDIHPEGGIVKTETADKVKKEDIPKASNNWKIASYISFVVIVALIVLNVIPKGDRPNDIPILDKSIAVLPFINDSEDKGNEHFINGIMDEILINLQSIKELRVPGRTSVEQYRDNSKPIPEIADEMNVAYIVEGSGQRYGNKIRLRVQLVEGATDKHLWAESYDEEIKGAEDIFRIQSQIAESIAAEIEAIITPEEKQLIERVHTHSLTAHDFYQRGREEFWKSANDNDIKHLMIVEDLYRKALQYDSSYAQAYSGLAFVYFVKSFVSGVINNDYLDSAHVFIDKALLYDSQLAEAYIVRGGIFEITGKKDKALVAYDKALELNPNEWLAYGAKSFLYLSQGDLVAAIENLHKSAPLNRGSLYPGMLENLGSLYRVAGFEDKAEYYSREAFMLDNDSLKFYRSMAWNEVSIGDYSTAIDNLKKAHETDNADLVVIADIVNFYGFLGEYEEALKWCIEFFEDPELVEGVVLQFRMYRIGLIYWENGYKEIADVFFTKQIESSNDIIESEIIDANYYYAYYDLASVYAFKGERDKAYENLTLFNKIEFIPHNIVTSINDDPLFHNIRDEPEFQQIVREMEAKYQAEHERVRQWLEENDML